MEPKLITLFGYGHSPSDTSTVSTIGTGKQGVYSSDAASSMSTIPVLISSASIPDKVKIKNHARYFRRSGCTCGTSMPNTGRGDGCMHAGGTRVFFNIFSSISGHDYIDTKKSALGNQALPFVLLKGMIWFIHLFMKWRPALASHVADDAHRLLWTYLSSYTIIDTYDRWIDKKCKKLVRLALSTRHHPTAVAWDNLRGGRGSTSIQRLDPHVFRKTRALHRL